MDYPQIIHGLTPSKKWHFPPPSGPWGRPPWCTSSRYSWGHRPRWWRCSPAGPTSPQHPGNCYGPAMDLLWTGDDWWNPGKMAMKWRPSRKRWQRQWNITIYNGKTHDKWPCSLARFEYRRVISNNFGRCQNQPFRKGMDSWFHHNHQQSLIEETFGIWSLHCLIIQTNPMTMKSKEVLLRKSHLGNSSLFVVPPGFPFF